jgi:hypothetical protein
MKKIVGIDKIKKNSSLAVYYEKDFAVRWLCIVFFLEILLLASFVLDPASFV